MVKAEKKGKNITGLLIVIAILVIAIASGWYFLSGFGRNSAPESGQEIPKVLAEDFSLNDLNGNPFKLSDFRGKVVLIDFMATWCGPCRLQMPHYGTILEEYGDEIEMMSIGIGPESEEALTAFAQGFPYATWIWAKDTANLGWIYQVTRIPKTVIIDQNGYIAFTHTGVISASTLITEIDTLLN